MHEMAITQSVVAAVSERLPGERVDRVVLEIGRISGVVCDAVRFCFDVCAAGTRLEGAALEIRETPGLARCEACRAEVALDFPVGVCSCGSTGLEIVSGRELRIVEVRLAARVSGRGGATDAGVASGRGVA